MNVSVLPVLEDCSGLYRLLTASEGLDIRARMTLANRDGHHEINLQDATMIPETSLQEGGRLAAARGGARYRMHE